MLSRQSIQWHAGHADADFDKLDNDDTLCMKINQKAIDWAMSKADSKALSDYNSHGKKLVVTNDFPPA